MNRRLLAAVMLAGLAAAPAAATWSIILVDTRTGEIAVGSATCVAGFDLRALTPVLIPGIGGATAQSSVDSTGQNRVYIRDRLIQLTDPAAIISGLATFDAGHQSRQYGVVDTLGRAATFSGSGASAWAGGMTGQFTYVHGGQPGTIAYAIQGNILTGAPVVAMAEAAVRNTPGDLAARMMAGMQAARLMGGDGRCSCATGPTACGSPPPFFTKSAHIAYMLIARTGDREGSNGIYRASGSPSYVAIADLNADSRPELLISNGNFDSFSLQQNITPSAPLFPMFGPLGTSYPTGGGPAGLALADLNGDQRPDVVAASAGFSSLSVTPALATGGFGAYIAYQVGASPRRVALGDFNAQSGIDAAVTVSGNNTVAVRLNDGAGLLTGTTAIPTEANPWDIVTANLVGGPALDLAVICRTANRLMILEGDGAGGFSLSASLPTATGPTGLAAVNIDGDADVDLIVSCDTAQVIEVFTNRPTGFVSSQYPAGFAPIDVAAGDLNGNGTPDLVAVGATRFATLMNSGTGGFALTRTYTFAGSANAAELGDLEGDGDLDLALSNAGVGGAMVVKNLGPGALLGTFDDGPGCATGSYYMNFNVALQPATAPDPVIQLQGMYDNWRTSLVGRPDALLSSATISPPYLPGNGSSTAQMTITLRDWQGQPVTIPIAGVQVVHAPTSAGRTAIGPVVDQGAGVYTVTLTAGSARGQVIDAFRVVVNDNLRPVTLMPDPRLSLYGSFNGGFCYPDCDGSQLPPTLNIADFTCFLQVFAAGYPYANCDQSTTPPVLNVGDFTCFLQRFAAGCP
jgi:hypothetical protein